MYNKSRFEGLLPKEIYDDFPEALENHHITMVIVKAYWELTKANDINLYKYYPSNERMKLDVSNYLKNLDNLKKKIELVRKISVNELFTKIPRHPSKIAKELYDNLVMVGISEGDKKLSLEDIEKIIKVITGLKKIPDSTDLEKGKRWFMHETKITSKKPS